MDNTWFKESRQAWLGLSCLWVIGFIGALMRFIMAFFQVQISDDLGISRGFISMAWSTNLLIAALCAPLGGWLADRYGPKKVMLASAIMGIVGTGTVVLGQHDVFFFIGYGVLSGFAGLGLTTTYTLIFDWFKHHRAKATALLTSASSLGLAISTPIFVSTSWLTWKDAFIVSLALSVVVTLPVILFGIKSGKPPAKPTEHQIDVHSPSPRRIPIHLPIFIIVAWALFTCGFNMGTIEMNLVAIHQLANVTPAMIALSMSVLGLLEIIGSLIMGYWLDRVNKLAMMTILYGIRVIGFSLLFLHLGWSPIYFAIAFGMTYLTALPGGLLIAKEYSQGKGNQTGWLILFHQGGGVLGALIGGLSFDYSHNYQALIGVNLLMCILVTVGYWFLYTSRKPANIRKKARERLLPQPLNQNNHSA